MSVYELFSETYKINALKVFKTVRPTMILVYKRQSYSTTLSVSGYNNIQISRGCLFMNYSVKRII